MIGAAEAGRRLRLLIRSLLPCLFVNVINDRIVNGFNFYLGMLRKRDRIAVQRI